MLFCDYFFQICLQDFFITILNNLLQLKDYFPKKAASMRRYINDRKTQHRLLDSFAIVKYWRLQICNQFTRRLHFINIKVKLILTFLNHITHVYHHQKMNLNLKYHIPLILLLWEYLSKISF